jgi:thiol-disulfide isomerase/thioredoxin
MSPTRMRGSEVSSMLFRALALLAVMCPFLYSQTAPKVGQPAPDFTLSDAAGSPIKLSALKGKVVLLDFWATWCTGCKVEIPWYIEFENNFGRTA